MVLRAAAIIAEARKVQTSYAESLFGGAGVRKNADVLRGIPIFVVLQAAASMSGSTKMQTPHAESLFWGAGATKKCGRHKRNRCFYGPARRCDLEVGIEII